MKKNSSEIIETVARVMAVSFQEDPMNSAQLEGVKQCDQLLQAHSLMHARHALRYNMLHIFDGDPRAFFIGQDTNKEHKGRQKLFMIRMYLKTFSMLGLRDLRRLFANIRRHRKVLSFDWPKEFITGRYYHIKITAVDKSLRGTGTFRKLIAPAIEYADKEQIPMVLETHNKTNVGIYERFGFELVKTIQSPETPIEQYCMIRQPVGYS